MRHKLELNENWVRETSDTTRRLDILDDCYS